MQEFRRLLIERIVLILLFVVFSILYLWVHASLGHHGMPIVSAVLNLLMIVVFLVLLAEISNRRRRMLEILGKERKHE